MRRGVAAAVLLIVLSTGSFCLAQESSGETIRIFSDSLEVMDREGVVRFEGNVRAQIRGATMTCDQLTVVTSGQDPSRILSATASGSVEVEREQERLEAGSAYFDLEEETVELTGSPSLQRGGATIRAERIIYRLSDGTATFRGSVRAVFQETGE